MRTFFPVFFYIIIYIGVGVSCRHVSPSLQEQLDRAERVMEEHPDSALSLLTGWDVESLPQRQQAEWALLFTRAEDKNKIRHNSDSLIGRAVAYYEKQSDGRRLMQAYYYAGRVYQDLGDALAAQGFFLQALQAGEAVDEPSFKGKIYANLGNLYIFRDAWEEAIAELQHAGRCFVETGDSARLAYVFRDIARSYSMLSQPDSAIFYYRRALKGADAGEQAFLWNELAYIYTHTGALEEADACLRQALSTEEAVDNPAPLWLTFGNLLRQSGKSDSAHWYLQKVLDVTAVDSSQAHTRSSAFYYLAQLAKAEKRWEQYAMYQEEHEAVQEKVDASAYRDKMIEMQHKYNYEVHKNEVARLRIQQLSQERNRYRLLLLTSLLFVVLCIALVSLWRWIGKHRRLKKSLITLTEESEMLIHNNREKIEELEEEIHRLQAENTETIEEEFRQQKRVRELGRSAIVRKFLQTSGWEAGIKDKKELFDAVDKAYPAFAARLSHAFPEMDEMEKYICYLYKIGITSNTKIAELIGMSPTGIASKRDRLYEKYRKAKSNSKVFKGFIDGC